MKVHVVLLMILLYSVYVLLCNTSTCNVVGNTVVQHYIYYIYTVTRAYPLLMEV